MNRYKTYQTLGRLLNLDSNPHFRNELIQTLVAHNFSWQELISIADKNLILQTLYPKIKSHRLKEFFPDEVYKHLKSIFELSQERNYLIISQVERLTEILINQNIIPLYMKGVGNILDDLYKFPGERILFDIDLLVSENKFDDAVRILLSNGYTSTHSLKPAELKYQKHYPILYKLGEPASLEIHKIPSSDNLGKIINTPQVFKTAKKTNKYKDCLVMSDENKLIHSILHSQIEHRGHIYAKEYLRNLYDVKLLSSRVIPEKVLAEFPGIKRISDDYMDIYYAAFAPLSSERKGKIKLFHIYKTRYYLNIRFRFLGILNLLIIRMYLGYVVKPLKAIENKELRIKMLKNLGSIKWYRKHLNFYLRALKLK